jgi:BirA family biotin operon repressor/biotin-[acetyl-CoA-carboxylase] ligase
LKLPTGHSVLHVERIDSTNAEARRRATAGDYGPIWIWADEQTGGRGRQGRSWVSEPGNLYATFLFPLPAQLTAAPQLALVAALAIRDAVVEFRPDLSPLIKWPNDILVNGAKLSGILAEIVNADPPVVAIGCGINVAHAPLNLPYPATALGNGMEPGELLAVLDRTLSRRISMWDGGRGFDRLRADWRAHALGIGRPCRARTQGSDIVGRFVDIAADGALIIESQDGGSALVRAGDVEFATSGASA